MTEISCLIDALRLLPEGSKVITCGYDEDRVADEMGIGYEAGRRSDRKVTIVIGLPDLPYKLGTVI